MNQVPRKFPAEHLKEKEADTSLSQSQLRCSTPCLHWLDRHRRWVWLGVGLLYLAGFNGQWRIGPDSALHMTVARNLAAGAGYTHPAGLHRLINPGLPYLTAATFRLFGADRLVVIHLVMFMLAVAAMGLTYWLMKLRFDRPTAVMVLCLLAVTETFYHYAFCVLTDMPFLVGVLLLLVGYELVLLGRRQFWIGLVLLIVGTVTMAAFRSVVLTVLAAVGIDLLFRLIRGPGRWRFVTIILLAGAALLMVRQYDPRLGHVGELAQDEHHVVRMLVEKMPATLERVMTKTGPKLLTESMAEGVFALDFGNIVSVPLALAVMFIGLSLVTRRLLWGVLVGVCLAQWLLFVIVDRYLLIILPLLALGWWHATIWLEAKVNQRWAGVVVMAMLLGWAVPNMVRIGGFIVQQHRSPFLEHYENGYYPPLIDLGKRMQSIVGAHDLVLAEDASELTYFSQRLVLGPNSLIVYRGKRHQIIARLRRARRLWIVQPAGARLQKKLERLPVSVGKPIITVKRGEDQPPFILAELKLKSRRITSD